MKRGVLIVLEGIDGSGKTTIAHLLSKRLEEHGIPNIITAEPRYQEYKDILAKLDPSEKITPYIEALLFAADRLKHAEKVILPSIRSGKVGICDRYYFSSLAYQGAQGVPLAWIYELNKYVPRPDIAFYLDIEPEEGLRRVGKSRDKRTKFERLELLRKAREIYRMLSSSGEMILVNTIGKSPEQILDEILGILREKSLVDI